MHLNETLTLPMAPEQAARMYADPQYASLRAQSLDAQAAPSVVQGDPAGAFTVTTELKMPTDRVPDIARRIVGSSVTIRETQEWQAPEADGSRRGTIRFDVAGTPATMTGDTKLAAAGEGSTLTVDGELTVKVPLVGGKIEQAAMPYVAKVLRREETSAQTYAAR